MTNNEVAQSAEQLRVASEELRMAKARLASTREKIQTAGARVKALERELALAEGRTQEAFNAHIHDAAKETDYQDAYQDVEGLKKQIAAARALQEDLARYARDPDRATAKRASDLTDARFRFGMDVCESLTAETIAAWREDLNIAAAAWVFAQGRRASVTGIYGRRDNLPTVWAKFVLEILPPPDPTEFEWSRSTFEETYLNPLIGEERAA